MLTHGLAEVHKCSIMLSVFKHGFKCSLRIATVYLFVWQGITGAFRPGVLTALMGASGAGKTTLMDVLADRKTGSPHLVMCAFIGMMSLCYVIMLLL